MMPSLALYRTSHQITVGPFDDLGRPTCAVDSVPIYRLRHGTRYQHDLNVIRRLVREEAAATVRELAVRPTSEEQRVSLAIERISRDFTADLEDDHESGYESPDIYTALGVLHSGREHEADARSICAVCRNMARPSERVGNSEGDPTLKGAFR